MFIHLYRRQAKLISEAAYYFTNLASAKSFIVDLHAKSLSIDEIEFEENMQVARLNNKVFDEDPNSPRNVNDGLRQIVVRPNTGVDDFKEKRKSGELLLSFSCFFWVGCVVRAVPVGAS